jgi:hypothetical protein
MEATKPCIDADTLDMEGVWELIQSFSIEVPPELLPYTSVFEVKFAALGPGSHGGMRFEGAFERPEGQVGAFSGETYYHGRGVQLLQMVMEYTPEPYCYYQLFSGRHIRDSQIVDGAYVDVGAPGHGDPSGLAGYFGRFRLRRTS